MDFFLEIISFRFVYFSKTILSHRSFFPMLFTAYILFGERPLCFIVDLLCLIKFLLCLVDLHASIFLLSFALYIGVTT